MTRMPSKRRQAYTLVEMLLVVGILAAVSAMVIPNLIGQLQADALPRSARQLRSLITLVRANAALDGRRYQIRFPNEDELDHLGGDRQPLIEREDDPFLEPEVFNLVTAPWAIQRTFLSSVWCAEIRLGRPTIEEIIQRRKRIAEQIEEKLSDAFEEYEPERLPLVCQLDGTSEWAVFVLTEAPRTIELDELENYPQIELIVDGATGLAWMQRPFYDEELDLFEEKNWPAVLRQDYLSTAELTEDDVLELRERQIFGDDVELKGRTLRTGNAVAESEP